MKRNKKGQSTLAGVGAFIGVVIVIGMFIGLAGFDAVDASHIGVKNKFGKILGTMSPGLEWTGFFTQVEQYDLRTRKMEITMTGDQSAVDKEGQSVYATIQINYRLIPDNVENAYRRIGPDRTLANILNLDGIVREGFKTTTSKYTALEVFQKRQEVKERAIEQIQEHFPKDYFVLENVIISNVDFNADFKAAIEQKKVAEETAKAKEQEVYVFKFEADKQIETARGVAESQKLAAEAEAYQIEVMATAEARALELKAAQLTDRMVTNNWIDAWAKGGSQVPMYVTGGSSQQFLMQMPALN